MRRDPQVAGEPAGKRLMRSLDYRRRAVEVEPLTPVQVAVVCHALADHTALLEALRYAPGGPWPEARSVGRWLHAVGDQLEDTENGETQ